MQRNDSGAHIEEDGSAQLGAGQLLQSAVSESESPQEANNQASDGLLPTQTVCMISMIRIGEN